MSDTIKTKLRVANIDEKATAEITIDAQFLIRVKLLLRRYVTLMDESKAQAALLYISGAFTSRIEDKENPADPKLIEEMENDPDVDCLHTLYSIVGIVEAAFMKKDYVKFEDQEVELSAESKDYIDKLNKVSPSESPSES